MATGECVDDTIPNGTNTTDIAQTTALGMLARRGNWANVTASIPNAARAAQTAHIAALGTETNAATCANVSATGAATARGVPSAASAAETAHGAALGTLAHAASRGFVAVAIPYGTHTTAVLAQARPGAASLPRRLLSKRPLLANEPEKARRPRAGPKRRRR